MFILTLDFATLSLNESSPCPRGLEYSSKDQQLELYNFSRHVTLLMRNPFIFCPVFSFLFFSSVYLRRPLSRGLVDSERERERERDEGRAAVGTGWSCSLRKHTITMMDERERGEISIHPSIHVPSQ